MDKNQIVGIGLIVVLTLVYMTFFAPEPEEELATDTQIEQTSSEESTTPEVENSESPTISTANVELDSAALANVQAEQIVRHGVFAVSASGSEELIELRNNNISATLTNKGGMFQSVKLVDGYMTYWDSTEIELWDPAMSSMAINFNYIGKGQKNTSDYYFDSEIVNATASEGNPAKVKLTLKTDNPSKYIEFEYTLANDSYEVQCHFNAIGLENMVDMVNQGYALHWDAAGRHNEKGLSLERQRSSVFFRENDEERDYLGESREDDEILENKLNWACMKQAYFSAAVISDTGFKAGSELRSAPPTNENDTLHTMEYSLKLPLDMVAAGNAQTAPMRFYFGPNDYKELKKLEVEEFGRIIDYGWWIFGWVNRNLIRPVFFWLSSFIGSAGMVILVLTILIKTLLFPITWKNYLSSAKMRVLRPEIDEINKKYEGKDAAEKQTATMALYKQTGVSPFSGCLPMLLQMPILYAMFRFFPASIELRGKSFLWADDLGAYDAIVTWTQQIPFISEYYGNHVSGFTVLMAASTFFYTRMNSSNMPTQSQPGMPNMKVIMNIFPFMMLVFFNKFAAGLSLYYFIANVISIGQMLVIKKYFVNETKIRAKIDENKKKPKKKSAFQERLQEMQKAQAQKTKDIKKKRK